MRRIKSQSKIKFSTGKPHITRFPITLIRSNAIFWFIYFYEHLFQKETKEFLLKNHRSNFSYEKSAK